MNNYTDYEIVCAPEIREYIKKLIIICTPLLCNGLTVKDSEGKYFKVFIHDTEKIITVTVKTDESFEKEPEVSIGAPIFSFT